jgi:hypothetical protein
MPEVWMARIITFGSTPRSVVVAVWLWWSLQRHTHRVPTKTRGAWEWRNSRGWHPARVNLPLSGTHPDTLDARMASVSAHHSLDAGGVVVAIGLILWPPLEQSEHCTDPIVWVLHSCHCSQEDRRPVAPHNEKGPCAVPHFATCAPLVCHSHHRRDGIPGPISPQLVPIEHVHVVTIPLARQVAVPLAPPYCESIAVSPIESKNKEGRNRLITSLYSSLLKRR